MEKYRFSPEQLRMLESIQVPFAVYQYVDKRVVTLALSDGFLELFGYSDRARAYYDMDNNMYKAVHPDDIARIEDAAVRFASGVAGYEVIYRTQRERDGGYEIVHAYGRHVNAPDGTRLAYIWYADEGSYSDELNNSSKLNAALSGALHEESILASSHYDALTGLPSMSYFFEIVAAGRDNALKAGAAPIFIFFDLCGLNYFNHKNGFAEGDKLLRIYAKILSDHFGSEYCCHIGQDHFAAFTDEANAVEEKLRSVFEKCAAANDGNSLPLRVGIYRDLDGESVPVSSACDRAKLACDAIKGSYQSGWCWYRSELRDDVIRKQYILDNFSKALKKEWIKVYYQPIIRAVNGRVCDEEALSRWIDPVKGFLSPAEFIPVLEEAGLIYKLDLYVLDRVLEKILILRQKGMTELPHSINLSRSDFDACDMVEEIRRRVDAAGVERSKITVEITESVIGSDFEFMKEQIRRFRALGFSVWMDDFGSGYSSLDLLQSVKFDLIKFDMSFMKKLDAGDKSKIVLTELMKLATSLDTDTVCEGVETEEQVHFLREIGCSKLQGFYFSKPVPFEQLLERYTAGAAVIGYENPEESRYFESVGKVNLFDVAVLAGIEETDPSEETDPFRRYFDTLPMGIIEVRGDTARFLRSNRAYRTFIKRFFGIDLSHEGSTFEKFGDAFMNNVVNTCCKHGTRAFYDEDMPDGSTVHSFARRIGVNPVDGTVAVAVAVLSITSAEEGKTYASIARALASDYYNIYYVDLDTERFIEYSSPVGGEELAMERHGENFFEACLEASHRIYEEDRAPFFESFSKEKVIKELDEQGVFTATYRLVDTGTPMYVNMKITRMQPGSNHIIMGVSIIDAQMKHTRTVEEIRKERDALARVMALSEGYLSLYVVDPDSGHYYEFSATGEYESFGFAKEGEDFFAQGIADAKKTVCLEDLPHFIRSFTKEEVLNTVRRYGTYRLHYRLILNGEPKNVTLRIASIKEGKKEKLVAGVRAWRERQ